jgi:hypothetical protein
VFYKILLLKLTIRPPPLSLLPLSSRAPSSVPVAIIVSFAAELYVQRGGGEVAVVAIIAVAVAIAIIVVAVAAVVAITAAIAVALAVAIAFAVTIAFAIVVAIPVDAIIRN